MVMASFVLFPFRKINLGNYNSITQVTVAAITKTETDNAAGGKTVTIGAVAPSA